jgi:hypothetical protein
MACAEQQQLIAREKIVQTSDATPGLFLQWLWSKCGSVKQSQPWNCYKGLLIWLTLHYF